MEYLEYLVEGHNGTKEIIPALSRSDALWIFRKTHPYERPKLIRIALESDR